MKKKKITKHTARTRFAGISLSMAVLGMMLLLLVFADRSQPVTWVAFGFGAFGVIGINVVYLSVIAKLTQAAINKEKLKRLKPFKKNRLRKKKGGKGKNLKPDIN